MRVQSKFYVQFAARAEIKIPNECFAKWNIKRPTGRNASAAAAALNEFRMGRTCELATMRQLWHMEALRNRLLLASAPLWTWSELLLFLSLSVCLCLSLSLFLTLSISFSPHSTSGRADKAKEGKLCIIMSSLFPYSHVSVCASASVCVCGFRFPCACVFLRQLLLTSLGPQEPQQTTATAKVETKNFAQFLCFSFIWRKIVAFLVSFPNFSLIPTIYAALWSD